MHLWDYLFTVFLDPLSVILGLVTTIPIFWTWYEVAWGRERRRRQWFEQVRSDPGKRPAILIVDLKVDASIRTGVESFRTGQQTLRDIPADRIFVVSRDSRLDVSDIPALVVEIRNQVGELIRAGVDTVHLFYAGPVILPAIIGAELANACRTLLYQHDQGTYICWGPLRHWGVDVA